MEGKQLYFDFDDNGNIKEKEYNDNDCTIVVKLDDVLSINVVDNELRINTIGG